MSPAQAQALRATVVKIVQECPNVKTFRLELSEGARFEFRPGQFVVLRFPDSPKIQRAYSIASSPLDVGYIEITLSKVGPFTSRLFALEGGETLELSAPQGRWVYEDDIRHAVLVSGGTGITPFRSIIRYVLGKGLPNKITLVYSSRTPADIIYRRELEESAQRGIAVHHTITRPQSAPPQEAWNGLTGRIDVALLRRLVPDFREAVYYICGPNKLVESLKVALSAAGLPKEHIRYEKWGDY